MNQYRRISGLYVVDDVQLKIAALVRDEFDFNPVKIIGCLESETARICKDRPKIRAVCNCGLFIKRYNLPGLLTQLRYRFRTPRPWQALQGAEKVLAAGVNTPLVLVAFREERQGIIRDYLVTKALPAGAVNGEAWSNNLTELVPSVMNMLGKLHHAGIEHGDTSFRNWYQFGNQWGVLDLDGCRYCNFPLPLSRRVRDVAGFAGSYAMQRVVERFPDAPAFIAKVYREVTGVEVNVPLYRKRVKFLLQRHSRRYGNGNL